jgi:hypothetical protein
MFPENFSTYVLYADTYATKAQEPELFERLLQQVIAGDPNSLPELVWEQKVEQKKAAALLARKGELFAN